MFIDPLPGQRDAAAVRQLAQQVMDQWERSLARAQTLRSR